MQRLLLLLALLLPTLAVAGTSADASAPLGTLATLAGEVSDAPVAETRSTEVGSTEVRSAEVRSDEAPMTCSRRSLEAHRQPFTQPARYAKARLVSDHADDRDALRVKLSMAQFHHLRAMHGITWSLITITTTPGIMVLGGALLIGGSISGIFTGDTGVLVAGIIIVAAAATGFVIAVPTLIGNIIQATATAARVEDLRRRLLSDNMAGLGDPQMRKGATAGLKVSFAF